MDLSRDWQEECSVPGDQYRQGALLAMVRVLMGQATEHFISTVHTLCNVTPALSDPAPIPDHSGHHPRVSLPPHPLHHPGHQEVKT